MSDPRQTPFECIDPPVGGQIWRLGQAGLEPGRQAELEAHFSACHACRLLVNLDAHARELARQGRLENPAPIPGLRVPRSFGNRATWVAGLALAASLAAVWVLPPRPVGNARSVRGVDHVRFLRPVEGEVLAAGHPVFRWTPVAGVSRYLVEIRDQDGRSLWEGESASPAIRLPEQFALQHGRDYKALLSVQPADLVPPGGTSVLFRSGSPWRVALHRLRWAHPVLQAALAMSLALALVLESHRIRRRGIQP